jgi:hypothetical protein
MDRNRTKRDRAQYTGLKTKLSTVNVVLGMELIVDALTELRKFQRNCKIDTTLPETLRHIYLKYQVSQSRIHNLGEYYEEVQNAANKSELQRISLEDCTKVL